MQEIVALFCNTRKELLLGKIHLNAYSTYNYKKCLHAITFDLKKGKKSISIKPKHDM